MMASLVATWTVVPASTPEPSLFGTDQASGVGLRLANVLGSIPSPSSNGISLGPIDVRAYGFLIALGVLAGVWLAGRRLAEDGLDPEIIPAVAIWVLPAAIVGA
ncbi:MAG: hypothetical protein GY724_19965, partial [Actinomycetia bacterium]|nr:hypothetical protein [Actinomycetes bacterium]